MIYDVNSWGPKYNNKYTGVWMYNHKVLNVNNNTVYIMHIYITIHLNFLGKNLHGHR